MLGGFRRRWRQALCQGGFSEAAITIGVGIDDRNRTPLLLRPQFGIVGEGEARFPERQGVLSVRHGTGEREQRRRRARHRADGALPGEVVCRPEQARRLRKAGPDRHIISGGAVQPGKIGFRQYGIFRDQAVMFEWEDIGRDQPVSGGQPASAISGVVVGHDKVEIEHQPVEILLTQTGAVKEHGAGGMRILRRQSPAHRRRAWIGGRGEFGGHKGQELIGHCASHIRSA